MTQLSRRRFGFVGCSALAAAVLPLPARAQAAPAKNKVVFQISDSDPVKWNLLLNNVRNLQNDLPDDPPEIEVVAYGPGIGMLKGDSAVATRVADSLKTGVKIIACENTMRGMKLGYGDMLPNIGYVPAGVVELMRKQQQGYAYIRP